MKKTITFFRLLPVILLALLLTGSGVKAWGQANPTAQTLPYSQSFGTSTFTSMPAGMAAWTGLSGAILTTQATAEASSPTGDATLTVATAAQTSGGTYGYSTSTNGRVYIQTSSNTSGGANQIALAINTTGKQSIVISYDVEIISAQPRTVGVVMQYRVGTTGVWTTVTGTGNPYSQAAGTTGVKVSPSLTLPAGANNQSEVQIRWATWRGTEGGNSSGVAIDNISVSGSNLSCSDPTTQASTVTFSNVVSDQMTVGWSRGDTPGDGVIVVAKAGSAPDDPADGTSYTANAAFTSGTQINTGTYVVYMGSGTSVNVTGLSPSTTYYYKVYEKNCTGTSIMINTTSPAGGSHATTAACAVNPTITATVAANAIAPTTASSGGTGLTSGENCLITAKGVCWNTTGTPTTADSKTTDGSGTTDFISSLTSLSAQTRYYVRAYATNGFGTNYGPEVTFRTLSAELASHPASFTASAASSSQINLSFSAASTITNADGYIILRRTGSNPGTTNIIDGIAPNSLTMASGTTFVADIASTSTTTYSSTGLPLANTQYNYSIIAYNWDGVNPGTYNYYTSGTLKSANATTLCSATNIPYSENFEAVTTPAIPACNTIQNAGTGNDWITASPNAYGFTTKVLQYTYNLDNAANAWFYSQGLNLTSGTSYRLTFSYGNNSTYTEKLKVAYGTSAVNTAMTNSLVDLPTINEATLRTSTIDFTPTTTGVFFIGFNCYSAADQYHLYVDDISVTLSPTCLPPSGVNASAITATTATISWTAATSNPANGYKFEVRTSGSAGSGATGLVTSGTTAAGVVTANVTGLTDNTLYSIYVQSDCGSSDFSSWSSASTFTTSSVSAPVASAATGISTSSFNANWGAVTGASGGYLLDVSTYPTFGTGTPATLNEGFENNMPTIGYSTGTYTLGSGDWSLIDGIKGTGSGNFNTGTASCQLKGSTGVATTPALNAVGTLSFYAKSPSGATLTIKKIVSGVTTTVATRTITSSWVQYTVVVNDNSPAIQIVFTNGSNYTYIDDVSIGYTAFTPSFVTGYSAKPISGQAINTSAVNTNILPNSTYYFRVRSVGANSTSANSNTITAFTAIDGTVNASTMPDCATCDVVVATGGTLTINANKSYNKVTVNPGGKLTLANGKTLTAPLTIESNGTNGTGTYVDENTGAGLPTITGTVQQYLTAGTDRTWWYLASPVTGASWTVFGTNKVGDYSESSRSYSSPFSGAETLEVGKGYVVKLDVAQTANVYKFENKVLNNGNFTIPLKRSVTGTLDNKRGFNLAGNPYPSYLNWKLVYNAAENMRPTIWYRTKVGNIMDFQTYNASLDVSVPQSASGYIPPMQAFWVKVDTDPVSPATVSNGTLNLTNAMRAHSGTTENPSSNLLKAPAVSEKPLIRLLLSDGTITDETVVAANSGASDGFDMYDSEKMSISDTSMEIYTLAGTEKLVINGMNALTEGKTVTLGFRPGQTGTNFTIEATQLENIDAKVMLLDKVAGTEQELTAGTPYSFTVSDATPTTDRFVISFAAKVPTGIETGTANGDMTVYTNRNNRIQVIYRGELNDQTTVSVYNVAGQMLSTQKLVKASTELSGTYRPGVYMIQLTDNGKKMTQKLIIK